MADENDAEKQKDTEQEKEEEKTEEKTEQKTSRITPLQWIIMAVAMVVCAGAGFGLGRLFGPFPASATTESPQQDEAARIEDLKLDSPTTNSQEVWYYELEPVVANLDEPGVTRYVRAALRLVINSQMNQKKTTAFLEEKKPLLTDWLNVYLASLSLEDIRGDRNLRRIQSQILDTFNEKLFPDTKPQIEKILFKEFAVQ
ncbi:MAG: flagellar basal body-associated FliL family protein [Planctomycetota bacterium]|jgi:flagellar basal body-associated protein FliL